MRAILAVFPLLFLAGCNGSDSSEGGGDETPLDTDSYTITVSDFPVEPLLPGAEFNFTSTITGARTTQSNHIGGHHGPNSGEAPSTTFYSSQCDHVSGELPGQYKVTCHAPAEQGVFYLRGHARVGATEADYISWWSDEETFTVAGPVN